MKYFIINYLKFISSPIVNFIFVSILFVLVNYIDQHYAINHNAELTIRLSTGFVFMAYVLNPYYKWLYIFALQLGLTYLLNLRILPSSAFIFSLSESITALLAAFIFLLILRSDLKYIRVQDILRILLSAIAGALVGSLVAHYSLKYFFPAGFHPLLWITWFLSSVVGIVVMVPLIIGWRSIKKTAIFGQIGSSSLELLLLLVSTVIIIHFIFNNKLNDIYLSISFPYLILPLIFWTAIRFHPRILSFLLLVVSLLILYYTRVGVTALEGTGQPFLRIVNSIQVFILFTVVFSYIMAGIIHVRKEAEEKVRKLNEGLEKRVLERTKTLEKTLTALRQSEEQFREAFEISIHGMALISLHGNFLRVNQAFCDMIGYPIDRLLKFNLRKITYGEDYLLEMKKLKKLVKGEISYYQIEKRVIHKENLVVWVIESNSLIRSPAGEPLHIVSQIVDITERKQVEEQLRKYTETLTVLLREVNHRVKNNLSALIGILHMEEDKAINSGENGYIQLLREVNSRIRGLATVHSMLSAGNWQPLEVSQLCDQIIQAVLKGLPLNKQVHLNIAQANIKIGSNQAHHLTLVINELATNSVKYGIGDRINGLIHVNITEEDNKIHIIYRDNGPGYPDSIIHGDFSNVNIGFELIRGIVTQSLDGELLLRNEGGAVTEILFANELN